MKIVTECGKSFYRSLWLVAGIVFVLVPATPVFAVKTIDVSNTKHNLSTTAIAISDWYSQDETEVCIFCHTPHAANPGAPLWNHLSTTMNFTVYSSATLESGVYNPAGLPPGSSSRLCLSCHEGTVGLNALVNVGITGFKPTMVDTDYNSFSDLLPGPGGVYLSKDLTNMHPVGFDYNDASDGGVEIYDFAGPEGDGLKFVNGAGGEKMLECATCHDPHVNGESAYGGDDAYNKFLRIPNTSSAMCLACHNK